jgi:flagellar basal-body rod modification protein FlgD
MAVTSTIPTSTPTTSTSTNRGLAGIAGTDFMNLLIKQLQYQDPLQPMTNQEMMQQMATIRQLEANTQLSDSLQQITDQERFGSAAALIGRQVQGVVADDNGNQYTLEGVVKSVVFASDGSVHLELDSGGTLPLANLQLVMDADSTTTDAQTSAKLINQTKTIAPTAPAKGLVESLASVFGL